MMVGTRFRNTVALSAGRYPAEQRGKHRPQDQDKASNSGALPRNRITITPEKVKEALGRDVQPSAKIAVRYHVSLRITR